MTPDDDHASRSEDLAALTGAGGRFETEAVLVHGTTRHNYVGRPRSVVELFERSIERNPEALAVVDGDQRLTFADLDAAARRMGAMLQGRGVRSGDRVGILGANSADWIVAFWACALIGGVSVPLNAWWTREELEYAIDHSGMAMCFVDQRRHDEIAGLLPSSSLIPLGEVGGLVGEAPDATVEPADIDEEDLLSIFYTSGTTGRPKGAMIDHRGVVANVQNLVYFTVRSRILAGRPRRPSGTVRPQQVALLAVPLFHVTGCHAAMVVSLVFGNQLVLYPRRGFDPDVAMHLIEAHRVTTFVGVPTLMARVLDSPNFDQFDLSSLSVVGFGGAPVAPDLARRTREALGKAAAVSNGYGLTETNAAVIGNYGIEYEQRPDSVGKPAPNVDVRIVDEAGDPVPTGERGEILIGGPVLMAGYWRDPDATASAIRDGWFHTGDVGLIDEDGFVSVVDRIKDVVIRGGENVYTAEVEHVLEGHPGVREAAVIGVAHEQLGEEVKAVVVASSAAVDEPMLVEYCRGHLAGYKVPAHWEIRTEPLPRNAAGKVFKPALREA